MNLDPTLRTLIEAAVQAPSGENAQPWLFEASRSQPGVLGICIDPVRRASPYSWGDRSSYVAIGAALENIILAASQLGKRVSATYFPDPADATRVVRLQITDDLNVQPDSLASAIANRVTNRKKYKSTPLTPVERDALVGSIAGSHYARLVLTEDKKEIEELTRAATTNEHIMLANTALHSYFFGHINWTRAEDERNKVGFYVKTLELPPPAAIGFKLMRVWKRALFLNTYLKMNKIVAGQNATLFGAVPAMGAIVSDAESPEAAIAAGRSLERVWLTATSLGLSMQPMAGLLYLHLSVRAGEGMAFSAVERQLIEEKATDIDRILKLNNTPTYFMFRIGRAKPPSAHAVRFSVDEVTKIVD